MSELEYTVVGVVDGQHSVRIHDVVRAYDPAHAHLKVVAGLEGRCAKTSPGTQGLLAAAVFSGRCPCAHRGVVNGPWAEDRTGIPVASEDELRPYTVVAIDPATRMLTVEAGFWASAANAERDPMFDFYLVASVLEGMHSPTLWRDSVLRRPRTTRNERIMALLRYSPAYAAYFASRSPIDQPA